MRKTDKKYTAVKNRKSKNNSEYNGKNKKSNKK